MFLQLPHNLAQGTTSTQIAVGIERTSVVPKLTARIAALLDKQQCHFSFSRLWFYKNILLDIY